MYILIFYVLLTAADKVKDALFAAGAGTIGDYDSCAWQCAGMGPFRPLPASTPHIGNENEISKVEEYRIEMVCAYHLYKGLTLADI